MRIAARATAVFLGLTVILMAVVMIRALAPTAAPQAGQFILAAGQDRLAERLMRRAGSEAGRRDIAEAVVASRAALSQAPYDTGALLRLAWLGWRRDGRLDSDSIQALSTSYARVPFDRSAGLWRINFALENWDVLPLSVRRAVQAEVFTLASEPGHRWPLRSRLSRIHNERGRVVAALWNSRVTTIGNTRQASRSQG